MEEPAQQKSLIKRYADLVKNSRGISRDENPKKWLTATILIHLVNLLNLAFWIATPFLFWFYYKFTRNIDDTWDDMVIGLLFAFGFFTAVLICILMSLGIYLTRDKRIFIILFISFFVCSTAGIAGYGIGEFFWQREFHTARASLDNAVLKLEQYKKENGRYPAKLEEALDEVPILWRGDKKVEIKYEILSTGDFSITYNFRYFYTYNSVNRKWEAWD